MNLAMIESTMKWLARYWHVLVVIVLWACLFLIPRVSKADSYGAADYSRSDYYDRSNIKEEWRLDPGVQGSSLANDDFEIWSGAEGGCTDCPTDWTCNCTYAGGDIDQETTYLYSLGSSAELDATGFLHSLIYHAATYEANKCYLATFCYKGQDGTEDLLFYAGNSTFTESYAPATDTWTGSLTDMSFANIGTSWMCSQAFIATGVTTKSSYIFALAARSADGTAVYVDYVGLHELNSCSITGAMGNMLSVPVNSDSQWGQAEMLLPRVGTGPVGSWGTSLDGINDYLFRADDDTFDPVVGCADQGGSFSVGCRFVTRDNTDPGYIFAKLDPSTANDWVIYNLTGNSVRFYWQDTTGAADSITIANFLVNDTLTSFVGTYEFKGDAVSDVYLYANYEATASTNTGEGPIKNDPVELNIGASGGGVGGQHFSSLFASCTFWCGVLSSVQANKFISPYFQNNSHGDGFYVDTCSQAASHATCSTQVCRDGTPNACQAEGTGVIAVFSQGEELIPYNSYEIVVGDDSSPTFTGWTKIGAVTAYRAATKHGNVSARMKRTGADVSLTSSCIGVSASTAYYVFVDAKSITGDPLYIIEYDPYTSADCTTGQQSTVEIVTGSTSSVWAEAGDTKTTAVGINSLKLRVRQTSGGSAIYDAISLKASSYRKPWVHNSGAGTTIFNARNYIIHNPLSDFIETEQKYGYEDGFCVSACVYTDYTTDGTVHRALTSGTVSDQYWSFITNDGSNNISFAVTTGAAAWKSIYQAITPSTWVAGTRKFLEACTDNASPSNLKARWYETSNSTWYSIASPSSGGGSTGQMNTQSDELHVGHQSAAVFLDGYFVGEAISISPYSIAWPQKGFEACKNFTQSPY